jgi:hypothetical protein
MTAPATLPPEPGQEPNLYLLDCERCEEPRYHLFEIAASYPLCFWMVFACGECGREVNGWLDRPYVARWSRPEAAATDPEELEEEVEVELEEVEEAG